MMQPGDILLYESTGKWYERAIAFTTGGPYIHTSIVINPREVIEAQAGGITLAPLPNPHLQSFCVVSVSDYTTLPNIISGLSWAERQQGKRYGWVDIFYQAIKFVWPNNKLRFGIAGRWDCSDYCTRYLQQAGVILPPDFSDPYSMTPNDLGRVFGLVEPRKGRPREVVQPLAKESKS